MREGGIHLVFRCRAITNQPGQIIVGCCRSKGSVALNWPPMMIGAVGLVLFSQTNGAHLAGDREVEAGIHRAGKGVQLGNGVDIVGLMRVTVLSSIG